ncbi:hypothetical protein [Paludisphaera mucosa]|uniref:Uncharacterized protein n=1 Tax=Paludisphaera mucosa TaxID=3030827 RepID=A0ABT6FC63_9BACT|nr:hypothetical protein [Paludisphaera mucosa]MDG3005183.1 hypothetical protein [Paludisphaera mucosa]
MSHHHRPEQYRLIDAEGQELAYGDTIPYFKGVVADLRPGRYTIQEVVADALGHAHEQRRWGSITHLEDGTIVLHPDEPNA